MNKPKQKKCKTCGDKFTPFNSLQQTCPTAACAVPHGKKMQAKERKAETRAMKKAMNDNDRSYWLAKAQKSFNAYIRERDRLNGCISCDKPATWQGQWHASHYRPVGNNSALRFHPLNCHKSCSECNNHKSGNLIPYRIALIDKIGLSNVEYLETHNDPYRWTIDDLKAIDGYYREQLKSIIEY